MPPNLRPFFFFAVNSKAQEMKISVRAPIKLSTDNAFCECKISCVIAVLRPIMCFWELCHSTLLLPQYIVNSLLSIEQSLLHICKTESEESHIYFIAKQCHSVHTWRSHNLNYEKLRQSYQSFGDEHTVIGNLSAHGTALIFVEMAEV